MEKYWTDYLHQLIQSIRWLEVLCIGYDLWMHWEIESYTPTEIIITFPDGQFHFHEVRTCLSLCSIILWHEGVFTSIVFGTGVLIVGDANSAGLTGSARTLLPWWHDWCLVRIKSLHEARALDLWMGENLKVLSALLGEWSGCCMTSGAT